MRQGNKIRKKSIPYLLLKLALNKDIIIPETHFLLLKTQEVTLHYCLLILLNFSSHIDLVE